MKRAYTVMSGFAFGSGSMRYTLKKWEVLYVVGQIGGRWLCMARDQYFQMSPHRLDAHAKVEIHVPETLNCVQCGAEYPKTKNRRTCSPECSKARALVMQERREQRRQDRIEKAERMTPQELSVRRDNRRGREDGWPMPRQDPIDPALQSVLRSTWSSRA